MRTTKTKTKTVKFKTPPATAEQWVKGGARPSPAEPMKRLTIDVPLSLHTRLKLGCVASGRQIADVVRELIERKFPPAS